MGAQRLAAALLLLVTSVISPANANFHHGDYIQVARKAQFQSKRTSWHEVTGAHCPRFGESHTVVLPLPRPANASYAELREYKLQLAFDHDRFVTPWLALWGQGAPEAPLLEVHLTRAGEVLLDVEARVKEAPAALAAHHGSLLAALRADGQWPKHLLVQYRFITRRDVDFDRGLWALFAFGLVSLLALALNAVGASEKKLRQFAADVVDGSAADGKAYMPKAD